MNHPLDGARLKVIRAQEHLESLKAEVAMYLKDDPYVTISQNNSDVGDQSQTVWLEHPPPLRLSTIVGDCVTNARAVLDYIVWELVRKYFQPAFDVTNYDDRRIVSFPISRDSTEGHRDRLDRLTQRGIPTSAIDEIQRPQPYASRQDTLWWLHELVNTNKHRMPLLVIGHIKGVTVRRHEMGNSVLTLHALGTFTDACSTDVGFDQPFSVTVEDVAANRITIRSTEMEMDTQPTIYVTWKDSLMPREPVDRTLEQIIETVANIIPRFDQFFS